MAWIARWLAESRQNAEATITVDDTLQQLMQRADLEIPYMPKRMYSDRNFTNYITERITPIASVVAYGSENPSESFGKFAKITGQLFKAGMSYIYDENLQWEIKEAMRYAQLQNIYVQNVVAADGSIIQGQNDSLARLLFGTIETMTQGLHDLLRVFTYQALQFGFVNYTDPRTKANVVLDYRDPNADYGYAPFGKFAHFPPDLAGTDRWDQYATANGLENIRRDVEVYEDTTGKKPDAVMMSRKAIDHLIRQESTRQAFAAVVNTTAGVIVSNVGLVDKSMLKQLMQRLELPVILEQEEKYQTRESSGSKKIVRRRFLNEDRYVFLSHNMGEQALGPTMEAELFTNESPTAQYVSAGPYIQTREKSKSPPLDVTEGVATMLPVIPNPKMLFSRKVFDL